MTFKEKVKNIWDYDKWYILGGIAAAVALFFFVKDIFFKEKFDYTVVYQGIGYMSETEIASFETVISSFAEDVNGDGKKNADLINVEFSKADESRPQLDRDKNTLLMTELAMQENCIFIMEKERLLAIYENDTKYFTDLSSICESLEENTLFIEIKNTVLYEELPFLDGDLVLMLRRPYNEKYNDIYDNCRKYVESILNS